MGFFKKIFTSSSPSPTDEAAEQEAQQVLSKGLEKSKTSFFEKVKRFVAAKDTIDDDTLDELEMALISSDVGVDTTVKIIDRIKERVQRDKYLGSNELDKI
ncbi:MAG: signal recognition particle receptor subunit alpha, partial [Flavobacteriales bacterium]|nr:signal recognition particle receptor subunit alpha [Flavobacteriales bacterium]